MSDPLKRWRPLLARVPLIVSLVAGVASVVMGYFDMLHDEIPLDAGVWAFIIFWGVISAAATRLLIWLSPNFILGGLFGVVGALPMATLVTGLLGEAGASVGLGLLLLGAAIGVVLAREYRVW